MKGIVKIIRQWRIRAGLPFGIHLWFDPRVEHVDLVEGPMLDPTGGIPEATAEVDAGPQLLLPWDGKLSTSGRGKREALTPAQARHNRRLPEGDSEIPF